MTAHDLDAARAARAEKLAGPRLVIFGGVEYRLVNELPLEFVDLLRIGAMGPAVGLLLADETDAEAFMTNRPTLGDLIELAELYGVSGLGEYMASGTSSNGTSRPSKPTSKRTTPSTSVKRSGGQKAR